jgi:hypothetical protein
MANNRKPYTIIGTDPLGNPKCTRIWLNSGPQNAVQWFVAWWGDGSSVISVLDGHHIDLLDGGSNDASQATQATTKTAAKPNHR